MELTSQHLQPKYAVCRFHRGPCDAASITVVMKPFRLDGEKVETALALDQIEFHTDRYTDLAERVFSFPINPADGYIDGSIYVRAEHHPVDVGLIAFGALQDEAMSLRVHGHVDYRCFHSNQQMALPLDLTTTLYLPASPASMARTVDTVVKACGATSPKHMGVVMRALKPQVLYEAQMGDFAHAAKARLAVAG